MRIAFLAVLLSFMLVISTSAPSQELRQQGIEKQEAGGTDANRNASTDKHGTEANPVFVKVLAAEKSETELANDARERDEKSHLDRQLVELTGHLAEFTGDLFYATVVLAIATLLLFGVTWRIARDAKENFTNLERAFVCVKSITIIGGSEQQTNRALQWSIIPVWYNSGNTPTRNLYIHSSAEQFSMSGLPANFHFPDKILVGNPSEIDPTFIGPKVEITGDRMVFSAQEIMDVFQKRKRIFCWMWAEYDDVFKGTAPHRTEHCVELTVTRDPTYSADGILVPQITGIHSGAEGDRGCYRKARPAHLRKHPLI